MRFRSPLAWERVVVGLVVTVMGYPLVSPWFAAPQFSAVFDPNAPASIVLVP
jgi:hypothetical protein